MKKGKRISIALLVSLIALSGCKGQDDVVVTPATFTGSWLEGCHAESNSNPTKYKRTILDITDTNVSHEEQISDPNNPNNTNSSTCGTIDWTIQQDLTYTTGGTGIDSSSGKSYRELNMAFGTTLITPKTQFAVDDFNTNSKCNLTGWLLNTPRDVSGVNVVGCEKNPPVGGYYYIAFILEVNDLYLSDTDQADATSGTTTTNRGLIFNLTHAFIRQ